MAKNKGKDKSLMVSSEEMRLFVQRAMYVVVTLICMYFLGFWLGLIVGLVVAWAIDIKLWMKTRWQRPHKIALFKSKKK